ncbi:MAG: cadherin-like domain-containing protein [Candidatus Pacebacteria bacterium]|nr:cadherin-like domain-containing protein [Candidatus Paceibacterota bacterium]
MSVLSRSVATLLAALIIGSVFSFTPTFVSAVDVPIAAPDAFGGTEGVPLLVPLPGVLANDDDGDGGGFAPLTAVTLVAPPSIPGVFSLGNDGSVSFTPTDTDFSGDVTFTYTVTDDETFTSFPATVTMTFASTNDEPVAHDQTLEVIKNVASSSVLSATDVDGGAILTYGITTQPTKGVVSVNPATGEFTYTPDADSVSGDSFTWQTHDGIASSTVDGVVTINVIEVENTLELCSNGTNNDADADTDLADSDCSSFIPEIGISFIVVSNTGVVATTSDSALLDGATTTGATTTATVGAHTVSAIPLAGYAVVIAGDCAADGTVTLATGGSYHCVITYTQSGTPEPAAEEKKPANGPISTMGPSFGMISNFSGSVLGASTTTVATSTASTTLPELPVGCTPMLSGFFRKEKMENDLDQVKKLQQFLNDKIEANLPLTGEFGPGTDAAVKQFQTKYAEQILSPWGITAPTGFVYLTTQRWINLMSCASLDIPMPKLVPYQG